MERVASSLKNKLMSAQEAAQFVKTGMVVAVSGFTSVSYPKAVPEALAASGHARDLTICVGAAVGDEIDGALVRAGLVSRRFGHQSNSDLRKAINNGSVLFSDIHISHLPTNMNQRAGLDIDVAIVECTAVTEEGLYFGASGGSADAAVRNADKVIVEVNETLPMGLVGMHDIFEVGLPPHARIIPITKPDDRIGTPFMPCPPEKIAAIVMTDKEEPPQKFKPITPATEKIGENVVKFLKGEIAAGRLPEDPGPIQSGVGSVGNAVLSSLASGGFRGLSMYTEVMQDSAFNLIEEGVFKFISTSSVALASENRKRFYENIDSFHDKIIIRPNENLQPPGGHPPPGRHRPQYPHRGGHLRQRQLHPHHGHQDDERPGRQRRLCPQRPHQHLRHRVRGQGRAHLLHRTHGVPCGPDGARRGRGGHRAGRGRPALEDPQRAGGAAH